MGKAAYHIEGHCILVPHLSILAFPCLRLSFMYNIDIDIDLVVQCVSRFNLTLIIPQTTALVHVFCLTGIKILLCSPACANMHACMLQSLIYLIENINILLLWIQDIWRQFGLIRDQRFGKCYLVLPEPPHSWRHSTGSQQARTTSNSLVSSGVSCGSLCLSAITITTTITTTYLMYLWWFLSLDPLRLDVLTLFLI